MRSRKKGGNLIVSPEGFFVKDKEGSLKENSSVLPIGQRLLLQMRNSSTFLLFLLIVCLGAFSGYGQDELPDNYLPISLTIHSEKLEGKSDYLEGFTFSMDVPSDFLKNTFDKEKLFTLVRKEKITGTLTYPNNRTTEIRYEVVNHRGVEDIYMKTTLGYFLWEMVDIGDSVVFFAINWWYRPPATDIDVEILTLAESLLSGSAHWHQHDDRKCEEDEENNVWSLFCALKYASIEKMKEYNHHNTAMQTVRFVIDSLIPNHGSAHTLKDYNNLSTTTHNDIMNVLDIAKKRIRQELGNTKNE
jgi:hypothetical protein